MEDNFNTVGSVDFTPATLVYQPFQKTLFTNQSNAPFLRYYNIANIETIVPPLT